MALEILEPENWRIFGTRCPDPAAIGRGIKLLPNHLTNKVILRGMVWETAGIGASASSEMSMSHFNRKHVI